VQADPHPDRTLLEPCHRLGDGRDGILGRGEGVEEGIALVIHLVARVAAERLAHDPPVLGERLPVGLLAQLVQEPGRALDVGEYQGDRAGGLLDHASTNIPSAGRQAQTSPAMSARASGS
jgi:hypothetical protein